MVLHFSFVTVRGEVALNRQQFFILVEIWLINGEYNCELSKKSSRSQCLATLWLKRKPGALEYFRLHGKEQSMHTHVLNLFKPCFKELKIKKQIY